MTLTWFEHATFWSGVRCATIAPQLRHRVIWWVVAVYSCLTILQLGRAITPADDSSLPSTMSPPTKVSSTIVTVGTNRATCSLTDSWVKWHLYCFYRTSVGKKWELMTLTWFEHATFWSGVRRATIAPQSHLMDDSYVLLQWILSCSK